MKNILTTPIFSRISASMIFPRPPHISKSDIDDAGRKLIGRGVISTQSELDAAQKILNQWRACHAYPINTFQATLRRKVARGNFSVDSFIAQRLKRNWTILEKLNQLDHVKLSTMQDIAGVRAVVPSIKCVNKLVGEYTQATRFKHKLCRMKDYILDPKGDGYRSVHLIYSYKNKAHPEWDGLFIELQIRTSVQHCWATTVESIHNFLGTAIKTRAGQNKDEEWTDFFAFVSSAFAYIEKSPIIPAHKDISKKDILDKILFYERKLKVLDKLVALPVAYAAIQKHSKKSHYCLIILDTRKKEVELRAYGREQFREANKEYAHAEELYKDKDEIEPLLVSTSRDYLQKAYAGFFGDTKEFRQHLKYVMSGDWI